MTYLCLLMAMSFSSMITVGGKLYNIKNREFTNVSSMYNFLVPAFASLTWSILWIFDFSFDARVLPYSLLYGIGYSLFTVGMIGALKVGSTSLTALVKQVALVGVSVWGFVFWDTPIAFLSVIGIVMIVISLVMCLVTKENGKRSKNFLKWLFFAALITVGNAGCSIVQKYQQMAFDYRHKNMFMFFGVLFAAVFCLLLSLKEDKSNWRSTIKRTWIFPALTGASSALSNLFVLIMIRNNTSPVIIYPGVAVGGLIVTTLISLFFFKERLRSVQWCGMAVGAFALILINL